MTKATVIELKTFISALGIYLPKENIKEKKQLELQVVNLVCVSFLNYIADKSYTSKLICKLVQSKSQWLQDTVRNKINYM